MLSTIDMTQEEQRGQGNSWTLIYILQLLFKIDKGRGRVSIRETQWAGHLHWEMQRG